VVSCILSTDKTRLTNFAGGKQAWPVYLTIGNIAKDIRRRTNSHASILIGYIPVTKLECYTKATRSKASADLFHYCMGKIVEPLKKSGYSGIQIGCADGALRLCFPILAAYIADNPEQCLIACVKNNMCHRCTVETDERGNFGRGVPRDPERTKLDLDAKAANTTTTTFVSNGLNAVDQPFWAGLRFTDIFTCLTPDLLHQLHRGVFKDHMLKWCQTILGKSEMDARFRAMSDHSAVRYFADGISGLSQTTGKEHKNMEKVFGAVVFGADKRIDRAASAMLDFIYLASLSVHTDTSIDALEDALRRFHADKEVFQELGGRTSENFDLNKLHSLMHYPESIRSRGALDGYNTEWSERLHIDYAEKGYRASNHINFTPQMTAWLSRREKVVFFRRYLEWHGAAEPQDAREAGTAESLKDIAGQDLSASIQPVTNTTPEATASSGEVICTRSNTQYIITKLPTAPKTVIPVIESQFGCADFLETVRAFLGSRRVSPDIVNDLHRFDTYSQVRLRTTSSPLSLQLAPPDETIRADPAIRRMHANSAFDTVLILPEILGPETSHHDCESKFAPSPPLWLMLWLPRYGGCATADNIQVPRRTTQDCARFVRIH
jgi:hypothetical protein